MLRGQRSTVRQPKISLMKPEESRGFCHGAASAQPTSGLPEIGSVFFVVPIVSTDKAAYLTPVAILYAKTDKMDSRGSRERVLELANITAQLTPGYVFVCLRRVSPLKRPIGDKNNHIRLQGEGGLHHRLDTVGFSPCPIAPAAAAGIRAEGATRPRRPPAGGRAVWPVTKNRGISAITLSFLLGKRLSRDVSRRCHTSTSRPSAAYHGLCAASHGCQSLRHRTHPARSSYLSR